MINLDILGKKKGIRICGIYILPHLYHYSANLPHPGDATLTAYVPPWWDSGPEIFKFLLFLIRKGSGHNHANLLSFNLKQLVHG